MLAAFTELKYAQKVKQYLLKHKLLDFNHQPVKELGYIYFSITKKSKIPNAKMVNTKFKFPDKEIPLTVESLLKNKLTKNQLQILPKSQETVGSILILEIPEKLIPKEKIVAEAYLSLHKNITTVVKKDQIHSGVFRTRKVKILAGKRTKETTHLENGIRLKLHLEKTYFSAKSGNERLRVAKQIKKGENVLVLFSGAGPFPLVFAKHSPAAKIFGVELNPAAHQFALHNVALNKINNITLIHGDANLVVSKIKQKFDRIAMPLPKTGEQFLGIALKKAKPNAIIHLYSFLHETEIAAYTKKIKEISQNQVKILRKVKCGQFSPGTFRMCFDMKVL